MRNSVSLKKIELNNNSWNKQCVEQEQRLGANNLINGSPKESILQNSDFAGGKFAYSYFNTPSGNLKIIQ